MKVHPPIFLAALITALAVSSASVASVQDVLKTPVIARLAQAGPPQTPGPAIVGSISGSWRIEALHNGRGRLILIEAAVSAKTEIDIQPQGRWSASVGCNRMSGRLFQRGEKIEVDDTIVSTKMSCPGEIGDFERRFVEAFAAASRVEQRDGKATLSDRLGRNLMVLIRQ